MGHGSKAGHEANCSELPESNPVWYELLRPDISSVLSRVSDGSSRPPVSCSLKELYSRLCNHPVLLDGGKMSFSLNRSGKSCHMLSARALSIVGGDDPAYWSWICDDDSRFPEVAKLDSVCWFDIRGKIDVGMLSPSTLYAAYLVFKSDPGSYGFVDEPTEARVGLVGGGATMRTVYLDGGLEAQEQDGVPGDGGDRYSKERGDGWLEVQLGEFLCYGVCAAEVVVSVSEVKRLHWKGGLIIQGIEIRPKESN